MAEARQYGGHTIRFTVQRSPITLYWRTRGTIEYTEAGRFGTFIMTGAIDTFTTEAEAEHGFLQQANGSMIVSVLKKFRALTSGLSS